MFGHKKEKRIAKIDAKYISGHSLYAHEKGTGVSFYVDIIWLFNTLKWDWWDREFYEFIMFYESEYYS